MSHGLKLHVFTSITWRGKSIWNRDIDKSVDTEVLDVLSARTGISLEHVKGTTLAAYEGRVYEKHNPNGNTLWIMPVGIYHRTRQKFGLQFCPICLAEDKEPYFRRRWRLAFVTLCDEHRIALLDRCSACGASVNFHRDELGDRNKRVASSMTLCHSCGRDLREAATHCEMPTVSESEVKFQRMLMEAIGEGWVEVSRGGATYSHLYFAVLHQLMRILATGKKAVVLREAVGRACNEDFVAPVFETKNRDIERLKIGDRRRLLNMARYLLDDYPHRLISICTANRIWSATLLRDLKPAPFWYWDVIHEHLYRISYYPSDAEIDAALVYMLKRKLTLNEKALSRWLGVRAVFRKRKVKKPEWEMKGGNNV